MRWSPTAATGLHRVGAGGGGAAFAGPVGVEEFPARLIDAFVGVRAEIVALRLQQVVPQPAHRTEASAVRAWI